ncbi:MAG TPA: DUF3047 domain-containing protein [Polyangiaceae bacterium]|nr:DUF3047 domain-containing protein [Polyangiaceae bacterium]
MLTFRVGLACALSLLTVTLSSVTLAEDAIVRIAPEQFQIVKRDSGPVDYYSVRKASTPPHIRAEYRPPLKTVVLGYQVPDSLRQAGKLSWSWRALELPKGGDECLRGKQDSAAVVYVSWRRGLRWYTLKYVYSAVGRKGAICDRKRNPFLAQDTVILRTGGPLETWQQETLDLKAEFRQHFEPDDPDAPVPDLLGIGIMTDGDQTQSRSSADYAQFVLNK